MTSLNPSTSGAPTSPTNTENQLTVHVTDEQDHVQLDATRYEQLARSVLNTKASTKRANYRFSLFRQKRLLNSTNNIWDIQAPPTF